MRIHINKKYFNVKEHFQDGKYSDPFVSIFYKVQMKIGKSYCTILLNRKILPYKSTFKTLAFALKYKILLSMKNTQISR